MQNEWVGRHGEFASAAFVFGGDKSQCQQTTLGQLSVKTKLTPQPCSRPLRSPLACSLYPAGASSSPQ